MALAPPAFHLSQLTFSLTKVLCTPTQLSYILYSHSCLIFGFVRVRHVCVCPGETVPLPLRAVTAKDDIHAARLALEQDTDNAREIILQHLRDLLQRWSDAMPKSAASSVDGLCSFTTKGKGNLSLSRKMYANSQHR